MRDPILVLENISAGYGRSTVVRNVSIQVQKGTVVGIVGPNGHGKTTLLNAISGIVPVFEGRIRLHGKRLDGRPPHAVVEAGIVHIPQGDLVFPELSVLENLHMGAYLEKSVETTSARLKRVFGVFPKLQERKDQVASSLSGGERRMLAIGRGLMTEGTVLLVDEPSLGLAPIIIDQIYGVLHDLKAEGRTILIVEENPSRLPGLADEVNMIDNGSVVWSGTAAELERSNSVLETYLGV